MSRGLLPALLLGALCFFTTSANAQLATTDLHLGIGLGTRFGGGVPLGASLDYPVTDEITVGAYVGYQRYSESIVFAEFDYSILILGARGTYHVDFGPAELDPYGGLLLGYNVVNAEINGGGLGTLPVGGTASGVAYGFFAGANYNFTERFGAFAEIGYGVQILSVGLNVNL